MKYDDDYDPDYKETRSKSSGLDPARFANWIIFLGLLAIIYIIWCMANPQ